MLPLAILPVLRDAQLKSWGSCIPDGGNTAPGERLSEVTVMLRTKFRNYLQAVVEKLAENTRVQNATKLKKTRVQNATKLKKIIRDTKGSIVESYVRSRMQPLKDILTNTIDHLQTIFEIHVFIIVGQGFWDQMGQDLLRFLEYSKENRSWYKGLRVAVSVSCTLALASYRKLNPLLCYISNLLKLNSLRFKLLMSCS
ncbi:hypothetical protein F0562_013849 [Nyssa sinensis]|uniref:Uncharacterized protein n=1 Tax=Nyssa sinensis TaxID=561372 RepID=A0A5J4ZPN5_9ASTE|nr:hypothetical protein F0562_013849 [Nyssa sinensis]